MESKLHYLQLTQNPNNIHKFIFERILKFGIDKLPQHIYQKLSTLKKKQHV
jgi:hypothetical protein